MRGEERVHWDCVSGGVGGLCGEGRERREEEDRKKKINRKMGNRVTSYWYDTNLRWVGVGNSSQRATLQAKWLKDRDQVVLVSHHREETHPSKRKLKLYFIFNVPTREDYISLYRQPITVLS